MIRNRSPWRWIGLVVVGSLVGGTAWADELDDDHALSLDFQTPHTDWAQPYALGPLRVTRAFQSNLQPGSKVIVITSLIPVFLMLRLKNRNPKLR